MKKKILCLILLLIFLTGCAKEKEESKPVETSLFVLDTVVDLKLVEGGNEKVLEEAESLLKQLDDELSFYKDNEIAKINSAQGEEVAVSERLMDILRKSLVVSEKTEGALDVSIGAVSRLWNFHMDTQVVPKKEDIDANLSKVDYGKIQLGDSSVTLEKGMAVDLGAIAKGYICDQVVEFFREKGVTSAIVNLGGNAYAIGDKKGDYFNIGIRNPFGQKGSLFAVVKVKDDAVVTSGAYERFIQQDGRTYHHILDPDTGFPVENDLSSTTIITKSSMEADAYSTALYVLGLEKAVEVVKKEGLRVILVDRDKNVYITKDLKEVVEIIEEGFSLKVIGEDL